MDFSNHPLSTIDNRQTKKFNKSIIDYETQRLRTKLNDSTIGEGMVALALANLGESQINNLSDYALRKANNPGRAFVALCNKLIKENA